MTPEARPARYGFQSLFEARGGVIEDSRGGEAARVCEVEFNLLVEGSSCFRPLAAVDCRGRLGIDCQYRGVHLLGLTPGLVLFELARPTEVGCDRFATLPGPGAGETVCDLGRFRP